MFTSGSTTFISYIMNVTVITGVIVLLMYAFYWILKQRPDLAQSLNEKQAGNNKLSPILDMMFFSGKSLHSKQAEAPQTLNIESKVQLEPQKNLYIIQADDDRFLVATTFQGTELLAKLEPQTKQPTEVEVAAKKASTKKTLNKKARKKKVT